MKNQRGYEYYAKMNEKLAVYGDRKAIEFFADLQVYGTPEQVHGKIMEIHRQTNNSSFVGVFSYAGMAHEEAARNVSGCMECHVVTGEFDYFMLVRTRDSDSFNRLHAEQLLYLPGVRQVRSFMVLKEILSTTEFPI